MSRQIDRDEIELKFDECGECTHAGRRRPCSDCDAGEFFEEVEPEGIDAIILS